MIGVVYKWQVHNKLNGSLFYAFEYASYLNCPLYIIDISDKDIVLVNSIFDAKYNIDPDITPISLIDLYKLNLDKTLLVDIRSFYETKEFLSNDIHVFANEPHNMFRYKNDRTVTYYGSYTYQNYDVFNYLKLNFNIFKEYKEGEGTFISGPHIPDDLKDDMYKQHDQGCGDLFNKIDAIKYVHTTIDTNNRIIPEAFFHNKKIIIDDRSPELIDSITLRYNDILEHGLGNYTLSGEDELVKAIKT